MQTKNINHDYRHHNGLQQQQQATQHHPGCASFRQQHRESEGQSTEVNMPAGGTCHHRSKTPVPPPFLCAISSDDSCRLERTAATFVPTSETHHQGHFLAESSAQVQPMTSQAALILLDTGKTSVASQPARSQQQVPQTRTFSREDCIIEDYGADLEQCPPSQPATRSTISAMQPRRTSCLSGSQPSLSTLAAFVTGANSLHHNHHPQQHLQQPSGHPHRSCHSPSQRMLLCAANSKTPPHQVAQSRQQQQRCLATEPSGTGDASFPAAVTASALTRHKPHSTFGHSSTLPPNSTLSSLLASARGNHDSTDMQPQELRRQSSMSHLDKVAETKCKASMLAKGEAKLGSFQQRLKAMLSSPKDSGKVNGKAAKLVNATTSTYQPGEDIGLSESHQRSALGSSDVLSSGVSALLESACSNRPLSTLNKYTVSVSTSNLSPHSFTVDSYDEEDSYHLRNVCNKLFSQKQYSSCLHSSSSQLISDNVMSTMQKPDQNSYRNITPEMNVDKINRKESIYSPYNRNALSTAASAQLALNMGNSSSTTLNTVPESAEFRDHVVVVSDLSPKAPPSNNGLTVRSQMPSGASPKMADAQNEGSTLSLNVALEATDSVASHDHNYKSSSESGRGTMNSHLEERSPHHIDLNSPADLTSLDSDQSHQEGGNWKEANGICARRAEQVNLNGYSTIQRYLDDRRSAVPKEADLTLCKEFNSKLSLNDDCDSWTSLSDEPSTKKGSSKSKGKPPITKGRHQGEPPKLKTDFSKPENCLSPNTKQAVLSSKPLSPVIKPKMTLQVAKMTENESKPPNGMQQLYDKCIYSVPNKGKYRNMAQFGNVGPREAAFLKDTCDNGSLSSDPESNFPDDGCSEFTDFNHEHHDPLRKQLRGIEDMYSELLNMLNNKSDQKPRRKLYRRNSGRSSVASRNTRDYINRRYRSDHRRSKPDDLQLSRRYKKLESQVLTLAKSVSQLSADIQFNYMLNEEMESLRHEVEMLKSQMSNVKQNVSTLSKSQHQQQQQQASSQQQVAATLNRSKEPKKVDKLKRLFVDEPQPMKQFLKKLGYEKYVKTFEAEKIGLPELVHLNEERLHKLGLPMGPRIRILQEARNLATMMNGKTQTQSGKVQGPVTTLADSFNIYAVV